MNPFVDGKWPEQELVLNWMRRNNVDAIFSKRMDLIETLTALRVERDSEIETLRAKLADCQAVVRSRGHDADCPVTQCCKVCGTPKMWTAHRSIFDDYPEYHEFEPGPCSDTCGHDRTTGEKA